MPGSPHATAPPQPHDHRGGPEHHHAHDHAHRHGAHVHHGRGTDPRRALLWALGLNGGFLVVELAVGLAINSLALISDAVHMLGDVAALALALGAAQLARRPADDRMTFGLIRTEVLGAFVNGVVMVAACAWIISEAITRATAEPPDLPGLPVLVVGIIGLAINLGSAWFLWRSHRDSLNVRAALVHMLGDALGSVGAIVAAVFILLGAPIADPIASLVIVALVAWATWAVLRDSAAVLLQLPPRGVRVGALRDALCAVPGVTAVHDLHVWTLDGQSVILTAHLVVARDADPLAVQAAAGAVLREQHGVGHTTLQLEVSGEAGASDCAMRDCGAPARHPPTDQ